MLQLGLSLEQRRNVLQEDVITFLGPDTPPSLATPAMIRWMEFSARDALLPHLDKGQDTVGIHVHVSHLAPTPLGDMVTYRATVTAIEGHTVTFSVEARDSKQTVGRGTHDRFIVDIERFAERLRKQFSKR